MHDYPEIAGGVKGHAARRAHRGYPKRDLRDRRRDALNRKLGRHKFATLNSSATYSAPSMAGVGVGDGVAVCLRVDEELSPPHPAIAKPMIMAAAKSAVDRPPSRSESPEADREHL